MKEIFKKPLIVGASVSADYQTKSPGKRLALRYTDERDILVIARNGKSGKEVLELLDKNTFQDRSAVVGLDLFFWDSFQSSPRESIKAMEKLFINVKEKDIPLILGEIPEIVPFYQISARALNARMRELSEEFGNKFKILPLNQILRKTLQDGYLVQGGKKYSIEALLPDGLHLASPASEFLADEIHKLFNEPIDFVLDNSSEKNL